MGRERGLKSCAVYFNCDMVNFNVCDCFEAANGKE